MVAALVEEPAGAAAAIRVVDDFSNEMQNEFNEMVQEMRAQDRQLAQLRNLRREADAPPPYNEVVPPNQPQPHHQPVDPEPNHPQPHHQPERVDPQPDQRFDPVPQPEPEPEPEADQPRPEPVRPDYSLWIVCLLVVDTILLSVLLMRS